MYVCVCMWLVFVSECVTDRWRREGISREISEEVGIRAAAVGSGVAGISSTCSSSSSLPPQRRGDYALRL
jgi:hypothetical protein